MPSEIRVDYISGNSPVGVAVSLSDGLTIGAGFALTCNGNIISNTSVTAQSFIGDGSALTNINATTKSTAVSYSILF